jgi:hypothetical protein
VSGKALVSCIRLNLKFILKRANWVGYYPFEHASGEPTAPEDYSASHVFGE